jgi:hypothetical protein
VDDKAISSLELRDVAAVLNEIAIRFGLKVNAASSQPSVAISATSPRRKERVAAAAADPISKAFRHFGLDPHKPEDRDRLLDLMAQKLFGTRPRGRPKGTSRLTGRWHVQLAADAVYALSKLGHTDRISKHKLADLLRKMWPERYIADPEWLRKFVPLGRLTLRQPHIISKAEFEEIAGLECWSDEALKTIAENRGEHVVAVTGMEVMALESRPNMLWVQGRPLVQIETQDKSHTD